MKIKLIRHGLLPALAVLAAPVQAVDFTLSGFGTLGYAQSDQQYKYQRFINRGGTLERDSIFGAQLDARFSQQWSATVQAKVAPSDHSDSQWHTALAWAFVSWRPSDDWQIRAGKIRLPLMLNTENNDVGATFDFARLPQEVYSISPMTDIVGLGVSKTWVGDELDWNLEAYTGRVESYWRFYGRERTVDQNSPGSWFLPINFRSSGLVMTARSLDNTFRIGFHEVEASRDGAKIGAPIIEIPLGGGQVAYSLGSGGRERIFVPVFTLGASVLLPANFRLTGEYARISVAESISEGLSRWGAYLALSKRIGAWTPYVYYARMKSTDSALALYRKFNDNPVPPPVVPSQKLMADLVVPFDQATVALGTSFRLTPSSLVKAEWSQVRSGEVSSFIDAPAGSDSGHRRVDILSLSYSFSF